MLAPPWAPSEMQSSFAMSPLELRFPSDASLGRRLLLPCPSDPLDARLPLRPPCDSGMSRPSGEEYTYCTPWKVNMKPKKWLKNVEVWNMIFLSNRLGKIVPASPFPSDTWKKETYFQTGSTFWQTNWRAQCIPDSAGFPLSSCFVASLLALIRVTPIPSHALAHLKSLVACNLGSPCFLLIGNAPWDRSHWPQNVGLHMKYI